MKLKAGGFADSAALSKSSLPEVSAVAVVVGLAGGKENVGFVAGTSSLFAEAKG